MPGIYGPADDFRSFFTTGPAVGSGAGDFGATRAAMPAAKVEFIGAIQHADGVRWQHLRYPGGTASEIIGPGKAPARPRAQAAGTPSTRQERTSARTYVRPAYTEGRPEMQTAAGRMWHAGGGGMAHRG